MFKRISAQISDEEAADRANEQAATEGGPDKRPQCAARSGGCSAWDFSPFRQCALFGRNVRLRFMSLFVFPFVNIAGTGNGA
ncbi:hypothetical protein [Rhizobium leucaenae]|uniref:hypothetical protein n=1 Tax=Rhizobium leucaenae TaxID=29450 RepID=UPI00161EF3DE|nr:hypothetical protein [Rhizobium leucaenae]MBB6305040.1 hypothetical protein [Rhizobium leucaenae]